MKIKGFGLTEEDLKKIEIIMSEKQLGFSDTMRSLIREYKTNNTIIPERKDLKPSSKGYYVRLYKDDEAKINVIAKSKGVSVPQEIRFRVSSTMGTNLYDMNEAKNLLTIAQDISKVGRLMNQAIKERLLMGTRITSELSDKIDELDSGLKNLFINTMHRIK
ncbi:TPA: hypothetical protein U5D50_004287 [Yersinia enterocolitica]|nr:hypothetical protein [Yersinia enterocolitica]